MGNEPLWVMGSTAQRMLGSSRREFENLVATGRVRSSGPTRGVKSSRRYSVEDISVIVREKSMPAEPLISQDGHLNLNGKVADWTGETFLDRLDSCWIFLLAHGYLDKAWSEDLRRRIVADVERSGQKRRFLACNPISEFGG